MQLAGKIILVTGASAGIGEDIARVLTDEGATVVAWDDELAGDAARAAAVAEIGRSYGRLDALVNAALLDQRGGSKQAGRPACLIETNFIAPMLLNFAALPLLQASRGHIFNVALLEAREVRAGAAAFAASVGALAAYTESLRKDMATHGIRVTLGMVESDAVDAGDAIADALAHPPHAVLNELVVRGLAARRERAAERAHGHGERRIIGRRRSGCARARGRRRAGDRRGPPRRPAHGFGRAHRECRWIRVRNRDGYCE